MLEATKRHSAVFLAILAAAVGVSALLPISVDKKDVMFYFMLAFLAYLAGSYAWAAFRGGRARRR